MIQSKVTPHAFHLRLLHINSPVAHSVLRCPKILENLRGIPRNVTCKMWHPNIQRIYPRFFLFPIYIHGKVSRSISEFFNPSKLSFWFWHSACTVHSSDEFWSRFDTERKQDQQHQHEGGTGNNVINPWLRLFLEIF